MRKLLAALAIVGGLSLSSIVPAEAQVIIHQHRTVHVIRRGRRGRRTVVIHNHHFIR